MSSFFDDEDKKFMQKTCKKSAKVVRKRLRKPKWCAIMVLNRTAATAAGGKIYEVWSFR